MQPASRRPDTFTETDAQRTARVVSALAAMSPSVATGGTAVTREVMREAARVFGITHVARVDDEGNAELEPITETNNPYTQR